MYHLTPEIKKHYWRLALVCSAFLAIAAVLQASSGVEWASLNFREVLNGQLWRLVTGHLIHTDWQHYAMNMVGLSLCIVVFRDDLSAKHWPWSFIFISLFSSLTMLFTAVPYDRYLGFSDVLHGWILLGAMAIAHKEPRFTLLIFVLFWIKILEEQYQLAFFTSYGVSGNVAKESHIYGAIGGLLYAVMFIPSFRLVLRQLITRKKSAE
jgi:rhomboid family GlyGly-CTERM serine protease